MSILVAQALGDPTIRKDLIGASLGFLNSAPVVALGAAAVAMIQWNLEHLAWDNDQGKLVRLSTQDTSNLINKNTTPLSPPLVSMAIRLTDAGTDTAEMAANLAQTQISNVGQKGAIQSFVEFFLGSPA